LPDGLRPVAVADRFWDFARPVDLSTGAVRLTTSFTSASVPWSSGRGMEGTAGARNGARSPTYPSRSQPISISRKPL